MYIVRSGLVQIHWNQEIASPGEMNVLCLGRKMLMPVLWVTRHNYSPRTYFNISSTDRWLIPLEYGVQLPPSLLVICLRGNAAAGCPPAGVNLERSSWPNLRKHHLTFAGCIIIASSHPATTLQYRCLRHVHLVLRSPAQAGYP